MKSIIREIIIILLLLIAIVLVLGIFLYDYIPTSKIVPKIEQYELPNAIKEELQSTINETINEQAQIVYEIDGTDLKKYEKSKDYQKGKVNPFAQESTGEASNNNTNSNNNNTVGNNTSGNNNSNSVGNYLPNTGTK